MQDYGKFLSKVTERTKASVIRELLKLLGKPGLISFAGGMPDPSAFPIEELKQNTLTAFDGNPNAVLQYGQTEGHAGFVAELIKLLKEDEGLDIKAEELLVTTASQQALDIAAKAFINEGDTVLVGNPTYLGAIQAFRAYGAKMTGVESDDYGIMPESLETELLKIKNTGKICKFIYIVPDFQNPTGTTIPASRRVEILEIAKKYGTLILEDSPYRQIRFAGEHQPTFYALDKGQGNVITMFTFSKTLAPGFRLGYIIADKNLIKQFCILKQGMDLCTSPVCQAIAAEYLKTGKMRAHVALVVEIYGKKLEAMIKALEKYMPEGVRWVRPEGGLFLWLELPQHINCTEMFPAAVENKVAYVVGSAFYHDDSVHNCMRLNFSLATFEQIDEGIKRLADTIKKQIK